MRQCDKSDSWKRTRPLYRAALICSDPQGCTFYASYFRRSRGTLRGGSTCQVLVGDAWGAGADRRRTNQENRCGLVERDVSRRTELESLEARRSWEAVAILAIAQSQGDSIRDGFNKCITERRGPSLGDDQWLRRLLAPILMKCNSLLDGGGVKWIGTGIPCPKDEMSPSPCVVAESEGHETEGEQR